MHAICADRKDHFCFLSQQWRRRRRDAALIRDSVAFASYRAALKGSSLNSFTDTAIKPIYSDSFHAGLTWVQRLDHGHSPQEPNFANDAAIFIAGREALRKR